MIYNYKCPNCTHEFEVTCKLADYKTTVVCEECTHTARRHFTPDTSPTLDTHWEGANSKGCMRQARY